MVGESAPQPVVDHSVHELAITQAVANAGLRQDVRPQVHALHSTGDENLAVANLDHRRRQHHCLQARPADLVHRRRPDEAGDAGFDGCLASRRLALSSLHHVAHQHLGDVGWVDARPLYRSLDGHRPQF